MSEDNNKQPQKKLSSFEEVWPHYLKEHSHPKTRKVHALTTAFGIAAGLTATTAVAITVSPLTIPFMVAGSTVGIFSVLIGSHLKYQGNKPVFVNHSKLPAVASDFKMSYMWWKDKIHGTDTLEKEYERLGLDHTGKGTKAGPEVKKGKNDNGPQPGL